jgi:hypothetical protein
MVGLAGLVALLLAGAVMAVVGDGDEDSAAVSRQAATLPSADDAGAVLSEGSAFSVAGSASGADSGGAAGSGGGAAVPLAPQPALVGQVPVTQDKVIKRAELRLEIKRGTFTTAFDEAANVAGRLGGFVASSSSTTGDDGLDSGSLVLRVPADSFDEARSQLGRLGTVEGQQVSGEEVGAQLVDLGARLTSLRAQEEALRGLMAKARTVGETLEVQNNLSVVRQQIEQLAAQQAQLQDSVALATIQVQLSEPGAAVTKPAEETTGLSHSVERALDGAEAVVGGSIVVVGYAVPLGALALLAWLGVRLATARRRRPAPVSAA